MKKSDKYFDLAVEKESVYYAEKFIDEKINELQKELKCGFEKQVIRDYILGSLSEIRIFNDLLVNRLLGAK